jgi:hypothetical protein
MPPDVPRNLGVPLTPVQWPQDTLAVPQGYGAMPAVDILNAKQVRREYFTYPCAFLPFNANVQQSQIIRLDKDGDFWCNSVIAFAAFAGVGQYPNAWQVQIKDITTGYRFFEPSIPFGQLTRDNGLVGSGFTLLNTWDEPYCFLRSGGIEVTIINNGEQATISSSVWFAFSGWKEYANAAP